MLGQRAHVEHGVAAHEALDGCELVGIVDVGEDPPAVPARAVRLELPVDHEPDHRRTYVRSARPGAARAVEAWKSIVQTIPNAARHAVESPHFIVFSHRRDIIATLIGGTADDAATRRRQVTSS